MPSLTEECAERLAFTPEQEQVFLGTMLGDGHLHRPDSETSNSHFRIVHSDEKYLIWKYSVLHPSRLSLRDPEFRLSRDQKYFSWRVRSRVHPALTAYRELFYPDGKKVVPLEVLNRLGLLGLAVWYMDDGCFARSTPSKPGRRQIRLSTQGFTYGDNSLIRNWFKKEFDFSFNVGRVPTGTGWKLRLTRRLEVRRFLDMLRPYSVPCMERKFRDED